MYVTKRWDRTTAAIQDACPVLRRSITRQLNPIAIVRKNSKEKITESEELTGPESTVLP